MLNWPALSNKLTILSKKRAIVCERIIVIFWWWMKFSLFYFSIFQCVCVCVWACIMCAFLIFQSEKQICHNFVLCVCVCVLGRIWWSAACIIHAFSLFSSLTLFRFIFCSIFLRNTAAVCFRRRGSSRCVANANKLYGSFQNEIRDDNSNEFNWKTVFTAFCI